MLLHCKCEFKNMSDNLNVNVHFVYTLKLVSSQYPRVLSSIHSIPSIAQYGTGF